MTTTQAPERSGAWTLTPKEVSIMQPCPIYNHCIYEKCRWWIQKPVEDTNCILDLFPMVRDQIIKILSELDDLSKPLREPGE